MTDHTPSGQQAVEHLAELFRDWFKSSGVDFWNEANAPEELAEIAMRFRTATPNAPSTAVGEREALREALAMICEALATPPAQSVEKYVPADIAEWRALARTVGDFLHKKGEAFRCGEGAELLDAYEAVLARPSM